MNWEDILKYSGIGKKVISELKSNIGKYGINNYLFKYVPDFESKIVKDFYEVLDEILAEIQKNYQDEKEWRGSSEKIVGKVKGKAYMSDREMRIQLAPVYVKDGEDTNTLDKYGRYREFYFYLDKTNAGDRANNYDFLTSEDYNDLTAIILQVER